MLTVNNFKNLEEKKIDVSNMDDKDAVSTSREKLKAKRGCVEKTSEETYRHGGKC